MISAEIARNRIKEKVEQETEIYYENICAKIEEAIARKSYLIYHYYKSDSFNAVKEKLEALGYEVTYISGSFGGSAEIKISWE